VPGSIATAIDPALQGSRKRGREETNRADARAVDKTSAIWLQANHGNAEAGRVEGKSETSKPHMARGRVESAPETAEEASKWQ
jgi:hypothetical protein